MSGVGNIEKWRETAYGFGVLRMMGKFWNKTEDVAAIGKFAIERLCQSNGFCHVPHSRVEANERPHTEGPMRP